MNKENFVVAELIKDAATRGEYKFKIDSVEKTLNGQPISLKGTVTVDKETVKVFWNLQGRAVNPVNPLFDLIKSEKL